MKYKCFWMVCLVLCLGILGAQEVAEDEFMGTQALEFTHFTGTYDNINTLEEIQGIGRSLASQIDLDETSRAGYGFFRMVHSYQPEITEGLDGDILILLETSGVDHVRNLRHIMAGYLEDSYGYSYERAYLLAEFITYYNAVYYQKIQHFNERFKPGVMAELTPDRCGLSTIYSEWPGRARIVIPLRNPFQQEGSLVDTSILTEEEVIEEMRLEEDQSLDSRKDMVELIEEEVQQEQEQIEEQREELLQEEEQIQEQLQELEEREDLTPQEEEQKAQLQEELQEVQEEQRQLDREEERLEERTEDTLDMRDQIAQDENQQIREGRDGQEPEDRESVFTEGSEPGPVPVHFFHYQGNEQGIPYGQIFLYDLTSGEKTGESTVTTLYGREYIEYMGYFLSVGKKRDSGDVVLMQIDRENLGLLAVSEREFFPGSRVEVDQSNRIYGVIDAEGKWVLGRFNSSLELEAQSSQELDPMTDILFYNGKIFVQSRNGAMVELNFQSLQPEKEFDQ